MRKPYLFYCELRGQGCTLRTGYTIVAVDRAFTKEQGTANTGVVRFATSQDAAHVKGMGGYVPDGIIYKEKR